jgi:hypothetical protein
MFYELAFPLQHIQTADERSALRSSKPASFAWCSTTARPSASWPATWT